jgi:lipoprotein-anchoring transpeptidase ErfK/SrfK
MKLAVIAVAALYLLLPFQASAQYYDPYYGGTDDYWEGDKYQYGEPYDAPQEYDRTPLYREAPQATRPPSTKAGRGSIEIVTSEHTLYYTAPSGEQFAYPIAVGREGKQWFGTTRVVSRKEHPEWRPTAEMRRKNPKLPAVVSPGPSNPLGTRALYLADGLLRIHGTNDPSSIGSNASSGCFRMYRHDVEELYEMVRPGTPVTVYR